MLGFRRMQRQRWGCRPERLKKEKFASVKGETLHACRGGKGGKGGSKTMLTGREGISSVLTEGGLDWRIENILRSSLLQKLGGRAISIIGGTGGKEAKTILGLTRRRGVPQKVRRKKDERIVLREGRESLVKEKRGICDFDDDRAGLGPKNMQKRGVGGGHGLN